MNYNGAKLVVEQFLTLNLAKDSKILDLAAGTGLVGLELSKNGYTNIDALDGSAEMLAVAKEGQNYRNVFTHFIKKDVKFPVDDHTYDHIVMSGALCHIDYENLPQIIKLCKPGTHLETLVIWKWINFQNELQVELFVGRLDSPRTLYVWSRNLVTEDLKSTLKVFAQRSCSNFYLVSRKR